MCALWLQENKQMHGYIESSSSNKTIHSTQYNTSQSPPQLTTISLVLSIHTQYIIITPDNKITPIAVCAVPRRDDSHNNKSIQQRRPPINYASRRSRTRDTVKLTVLCVSACLCVCVSVPAVTAQRLQCDEN